MKYSFLMGYQHFHLICFAPVSKIIGIVDRMQSIGSWSILDSGSAVDHHDWHWSRPWSSRTELRFHSISFDTQAARDKMQQVVQRRTDFSYRIENQVSDVGNDLRQVFVWLKWIDTQVFNTLFHFVSFRRNFEMLLFLSFLLYAFFRLCPMLLLWRARHWVSLDERTAIASYDVYPRNIDACYQLEVFQFHASNHLL